MSEMEPGKSRYFIWKNVGRERGKNYAERGKRILEKTLEL